MRSQKRYSWIYNTYIFKTLKIPYIDGNQYHGLKYTYLYMSQCSACFKSSLQYMGRFFNTTEILILIGIRYGLGCDHILFLVYYCYRTFITFLRCMKKQKISTRYFGNITVPHYKQIQQKTLVPTAFSQNRFFTNGMQDLDYG